MNGYFSLIQYCPLMERRESANVGVVLIVPEARYAGVRMAHDHARLKKMFGKHAGDKASVAVLIESIAGRVAAEKETLATLEGLQQFIATRANRVMLTDPCSVLVEGTPEATLEELMEELVASEGKGPAVTKAVTHTQLEQRWLMEVTQRLTSPRLAPYLRQNMEVRVPRLINPLTAPLGYQNGRLHLIQPEEFAAASGERIEERISLRALQGEALYGHRDRQFGALQLTVVAEFPPEHPEVKEMAEGIFRDHHVRLFTSETLGHLEEEIIREGKILA